jgi:hypothetical protein
VFALTPPDAAGGDWTETTIHSFLLDGSLPYGGLAVGKNGSLYGTTSGGNGSAFELVSPEWTESFYNFMEPGGIEPYAGLAIGADGALFGTTYTGGTLNPNCALLGCGTVRGEVAVASGPLARRHLRCAASTPASTFPLSRASS